MSKERLVESTSIDFLALWISRSDKVANEARKKELKSLRTTLSATNISRLFPEPTNTCPHYTPYIATPTMLEDFIEQRDPEWENKSDFSFMPIFQSLIGILRDTEGEAHLDYAVLRGFYRLLMIQNLLQSGWRPEREDLDVQLRQTEKDREFKRRLKNLAEYAHSNTWKFFSEEGYGIWKTAQAEILAYMETMKTEPPVWRKIFQRTQKDLRGR